MQRREIVKCGLAGLALAALPRAAWPQSAFPTRPLRLVVPFPPGGPTDVFARQYATRLAAVLGQPVVIENKSGASGAIGSAEVRRSEPDGYTLLFGTASTHGLYNLISRQPQYDSIRDFAHIAIVGGAPAAFAANLSQPPTLKGVVDLARSSPGRLQYGSPGEGTYLHLAAERLKKEAGGIDMQHIPFRGTAQSMPALLGGQVGMIVDTLGSSLANHKAGKLRLLAVASARRSALAPDVPTVDEAIGTRGFEAVLWNLVAAPAGTPPAVVNTLSVATAKVMSDASLHEQLARMAITPTTDSTPASALAYVRSEMEKWRPVVDATGIRSD